MDSINVITISDVHNLVSDIENKSKEVPAYQRPALRPSRGGSFRVYKDQWDRINKDYPTQGSELVRALLDKFFRGEIPDVKEQLRG